MSKKNVDREKSSLNSIKAKDFKVKFKRFNSEEKAIRIISGLITAIIMIILIIMMIRSIIDQQYINIFIYVVILVLVLIPSEIIEGKIKKKVQKRIIKELIEKKVEKEIIFGQPISHGPKTLDVDKKLLVFVSYATKDADIFKVKELAEVLSKYEKIADVLYWQEDMKDNIIKYMNDNLGKCDVMLLCCSPNALRSEPVEKEWTAADMMRKPIIPVFNNPDHIPPLLKTRLGVQFDPFNFEKNIDEIYSLILKKI